MSGSSADKLRNQAIVAVRGNAQIWQWLCAPVVLNIDISDLGTYTGCYVRLSSYFVHLAEISNK